MTSKWLEEAEYGSHVEEIETFGFLEKQHHSLTMYTWDALNLNVKRTRVLLTNTVKCSNHDFLLQQLKSDQGGRHLTQRRSHGLTTWKAMLKSAARHIVN